MRTLLQRVELGDSRHHTYSHECAVKLAMLLEKHLSDLKVSRVSLPQCKVLLPR